MTIENICQHITRCNVCMSSNWLSFAVIFFNMLKTNFGSYLSPAFAVRDFRFYEVKSIPRRIMSYIMDAPKVAIIAA